MHGRCGSRSTSGGILGQMSRKLAKRRTSDSRHLSAMVQQSAAITQSGGFMDDQHLALRFPRSSKYNPGWIVENGFGGNPLWQTEWLCERLSLSPGMRVLD